MPPSQDQKSAIVWIKSANSCLSPLGALEVIKRIHRYLKGTISHGLLLQPSLSTLPLPLQAFFDVDWASNPDDRRFTSASCIYLGPNLVSRWSKKQLVARPSTEAEYRRLALTASEITWIRSLLKGYSLHVTTSTPVTTSS